MTATTDLDWDTEVDLEAGPLGPGSKPLVRLGAREVTLIGQNVNSYADGDIDFAGLVAAADAADGQNGLPRQMLVVLLVQEIEHAGVEPQSLAHARATAQIEGDESRSTVLAEVGIDPVLLGNQAGGAGDPPTATGLAIVATAQEHGVAHLDVRGVRQAERQLDGGGAGHARAQALIAAQLAWLADVTQ